MKIEAVSVLRRAHSDLVAQGFALADLARDERHGVWLVHPQEELGGRHRGEHRALFMAIDPAKLRAALVSENGGKAALAATRYPARYVGLPAKRRQHAA